MKQWDEFHFSFTKLYWLVVYVQIMAFFRLVQFIMLFINKFIQTEVWKLQQNSLLKKMKMNMWQIFSWTLHETTLKSHKHEKEWDLSLSISFYSFPTLDLFSCTVLGKRGLFCFYWLFIKILLENNVTVKLSSGNSTKYRET